jgi:YD repeat-containing protein
VKISPFSRCRLPKSSGAPPDRRWLERECVRSAGYPQFRCSGNGGGSGGHKGVGSRKDIASFFRNADLIQETDRNGRVGNFSYDNLHRRTAEEWMNGVNVIRTISYSYDAASQLTSAADPDSSYAYAYDDLGRVTSVDNNGTPGVSRVVLASVYDAMNNRTQLAATIAGTADFLNAYEYDALNRLTQLVQQGQSGGNSVSTKGAELAYNALGQLTSIFRSNFFGVGPRPDIATSTFS